MPQQGGTKSVPAPDGQGAANGGCLGSCTIPSGQRCRRAGGAGGTSAAASPLEEASLALPNRCGTSWACFGPSWLSFALGMAAKDFLKHQPAARAVANARSVPWCSPGAGSSPCRGLQERCHGHAGKAKSPGASLCPRLSPTSSPVLLSCGTPAPRLHHLLSSFFSSFFFGGLWGGRGWEDQPVNVDVG